MSDAEIIARTPSPRTRQSLARDLRALGLETGMTALIHSSLSSLGWVCGGTVAVVQALQDVVTTDGTLVMPSQSPDYSDPAGWSSPPVQDEWVPVIRAAMPAFDPHTTPSRHMGQIAEHFRTLPGVVRSAHPTTSFSAWGRHADYLISDHQLEYALGETSPLRRIYDLGGQVLLLGVDYNRNTSFHLAEYRVGGAKEYETGAPVLENGERVWRRYRNIEFHDEVFNEIGRDLEASGRVRIGTVGSATARLFPQPAAVDFAVAWMHRRRGTAPAG